MADPRFHKITAPKTLADLAKITGAELQGDETAEVSDVAPLDTADVGNITFLDNIKYKDAFKSTKATACIIAPKMAEFAPEGCNLLISKNPYKAYALIAQAFYPANAPQTNISKQAHIDDGADIKDGCTIEAGAVVKAGAKIATNCWIESGAIIGENVEIGENSRIGCNAVVSHSIIGEATRIYPGACIGQDGFGFAIDPAGHVKVPQLGRVIIGDHVEIGANTCIDRGSGPDTIIGNGVWIDNHVQIGHNVKVGNGCVLVAHVGIAGSATLEDYVVLGGQVGIAGHITIGMGTRVAAQSGIIKSVPAGSELMGSPAIPIKDHLKQIATLKKLTKPKK